MRVHNIGFHQEIRKIISELSLLLPLLSETLIQSLYNLTSKVSKKPENKMYICENLKHILSKLYCIGDSKARGGAT